MKQAIAKWRSPVAIGLLGLATALCVAFAVPTTPDAPAAGAMAGIAVLMAIFWVFEVLPIPVTSLIPLVAMPLLGVAGPKLVAVNYGKPTIFLFLGGFLLALGLQKTRLHRRIALNIIARIGGQPARLVLGFMLASAGLSMWISNTASVMVMLPIVMSVLGEAREQGVSEEDLKTTALALMLGIAYSADIGGMATLVGTPPNLAFAQLQTDLFPAGPVTSFSEWTLLGLPISVTFLTVGWFLLTRVIFRLPKTSIFGESSRLQDAVRELGPTRRDEWAAGLIFGTTALLWMTGGDLELGETVISGWRSLTGLKDVSDAVVAVAGALVLFAVPSKERPGEALMVWEDAAAVPWGLLLLFGGGFALAAGFGESGLSLLVGEAIMGAQGVHPVVVTVVVCVVLTFLTELTSNTATTNLVLPILASAAVALEIDPRVLMIPATLSASCAFMMPVASPTQAIVFGSGYVPIKEMVRAGIWFNVVGVIIVSLGFFLIGVPILDIDLSALPDWARTP